MRAVLLIPSLVVTRRVIAQIYRGFTNGGRTLGDRDLEMIALSLSISFETPHRFTSA